MSSAKFVQLSLSCNETTPHQHHDPYHRQI